MSQPSSGRPSPSGESGVVEEEGELDEPGVAR